MAATTDAVLAFIVAAAIAWLTVPYAERLAYRIGAIDLPKERGLHDRPMPRLSGLAIFAGIEVAGWIKKGNNGSFMSCTIKPKGEKPAAKPEPVKAASMDDDGEDIPF